MSLVDRVAAAMYEAPAPDDEPGAPVTEWPPAHPDDLAWWITLAQAAVEVIQPQGEPSDVHKCETCSTCGVHEARHEKCCGCYDGVCCQEPSDAQVYDAETAFWAHKERTGVFRGAMRAALRAASVTEQGENRNG